MFIINLKKNMIMSMIRFAHLCHDINAYSIGYNNGNGPLSKEAAIDIICDALFFRARFENYVEVHLTLIY